MLDRIRHALRADKIRHSLREKAMRAVDEVIRPYHREQAEHIDRLEREVVELREELARQSDRTRGHLVDFEVRSRRDLVFAADQEAARSSARFVHEYMTAVPHFPHPHATLEHGLSLAPTGGMALEFGVFTGTTLKIIAAARGGAVYGFDSFRGLPEDWRIGFPEGAFGVDGLPDVPGAELVVGLFDDTLPGFLAEHPGPVDFLHVDSDLYSSAVTVLDQVGPRLRAGSVIVFDEFFNFPEWQRHEYRAWREYVDRTGIRFEYVGYSYDNEQVIVRITATGDAGTAPEPASRTGGTDPSPA